MKWKIKYVVSLVKPNIKHSRENETAAVAKHFCTHIVIVLYIMFWNQCELSLGE